MFLPFDDSLKLQDERRRLTLRLLLPNFLFLPPKIYPGNIPDYSTSQLSEHGNKGICQLLRVITLGAGASWARSKNAFLK